MGLLLEAVEVTGPFAWRWLLRDADGGGSPLADQPVCLKESDQDLVRFSDLYTYERAYAAPDRRIEDGTRFTRLAGEWAGKELLGERVGAAILAESPVTVRVTVPAVLEQVLLWPLELAHVDGKPLAAQGDVTFVYDLAPDVAPRRKTEVGETLRMLAVFSQPSRTSVLALRRERYALTRLIREIAARERARIHLQIVQYGATRRRLREIAEDGDGWDILHLSGHGTGGVLALEHDDGTSDLVPVDALVQLLRPARRQLKLAVVSACESAADTTAQTLRLLGLTEQAEQLEAADTQATAAEEEAADTAAAGATTAGIGAPVGNTGGSTAAAAVTTEAGAPGDSTSGPATAGAMSAGADAPAHSASGSATAGAVSAGANAPADNVSEPAAAAAATAEANAPGGGTSGSAAAGAASPAVSAGGAAVAGAVAPGPDASGSGVSGSAPVRQAPAEVPGLARALVRELDCAVVAMRYPVSDEFAIAYGDAFYEHLFEHRQPADLAAAKALAHAAGSEPTAGCPPLSIATPGLFGGRAIDLSLRLPQGAPVISLADQRMAYFPPEPARFVGRAAAMAQASAALARRSDRTAILLHGMAGAGKTAAALELAYRHAENFAAAAWWQAPTREDEWPTALADFANRLDIQFADYGFTMASAIGTTATLDAFLPRLRSVMESAGILLVLDNLETILTPEGTWRDDRWEKLITALTDHDGESRVILTTRTPPATLTTGPVSGRVVTLPVHALSLDESIALARELPNLRALLHTEAAPVRVDKDSATPYERAEATRELAAADRDRVRRVLNVVQGHPKLMELADAAAADRARLETQLKAAEEAAAGQGLEAFFRDGASALAPGDFLASLSVWTLNILQVLPAEARLMAEFVVCLEETDRTSSVISVNWPDLWTRLERPGAAPAPEPLLRLLATAALVEAEPDAMPAAAEASAGPAGEPAPVNYHVHPGVAAAIVAAADPAVREAVDAELAVFWDAVFDVAWQREGGEDGALVVRAGLAAAPYLLRRQDWRSASILLEQAAVRDESPGVVQAVLPSLRRIAAATGASVDAGILGRALMRVDRAEAERLLRGALDDAAGAGDYQTASAAAGQLCTLLLEAGRLAEALEVAGQVPEFTRLAGLGPWTQLLDQGRRLQVLGLMGEHAQVLAEVDRLRTAIADLPDHGDPDEVAYPWNVRELILGIGHTSALATGAWARCLELNAEIVASMRSRGAGVHELTRLRFNDAAPLIRLGRVAEAGRLLAECQRVFENHADTTRLARVLSERANLEASLGRTGAAADLERAALRLRYTRPEPRDIVISHYNLANYLGRLGAEREGQRAHRLAAALICHPAGMAHEFALAVGALADELREPGGADRSLPSTLAQVVSVAEQTEGVRLADLLTALQPDPRAVEAVLSEILRIAAELPPEDSAANVQRYIEQWEQVIAAIAATCQSGQPSASELTELLDEQAKQQDWAALVAVLRRILDGERDEPALLEGLDEVDTAIVRETLSRVIRAH